MTFATTVHAESGSHRRGIANPSWAQMAELLRELGLPGLSRVHLFNDDGSESLTVWGEGERFAIAAFNDESECYIFENGSPRNGGAQFVVDRRFDESQVCHDRALVSAIVKAFFERGERLQSVHWASESVGA